MSNAPASDPAMEDTANAMFLATSNLLNSGLSRKKVHVITVNSDLMFLKNV